MPGLVVQGFRSIGGESVAIPAIVAIVFAVLLAAIVTIGIAELLGEKWGLLAGSILLSAPIFVTLTVRQCADIPLTAFVFAASLIAVLADRSEAQTLLSLIALAGFTLSFAAWCKNEGIVFLLAIPIAFLVRPAKESRIGSHGRATEALAWAAGALPIVVLLVVFKLRFAPGSDVFPAGGAEIVHRLISPARWTIVALALVKRVVAVQEWGLHLLATIVASLYLLLHRRRGFVVDPTACTIALGLVPVALSFGVVYLVSPHDLAWHVRYSFDRLAFQCWPSALLTIFIAIGRKRGY